MRVALNACQGHRKRGVPVDKQHRHCTTNGVADNMDRLLCARSHKRRNVVRLILQGPDWGASSRLAP